MAENKPRVLRASCSHGGPGSVYVCSQVWQPQLRISTDASHPFESLFEARHQSFHAPQNWIHHVPRRSVRHACFVITAAYHRSAVGECRESIGAMSDEYDVDAFGAPVRGKLRREETGRLA